MLTISPATTARLYGAGAGLALGAWAFVDTQRLVWRNAAETCKAYGTLKPLPREPETELFFGPRTRAIAVRSWNLAIDGTLGALATQLAKRGL